MNFILLLSCLVWVRDAHAYLDPGTGSLMIQSTIAAITGVLFVLKTYWHKLKTIFFSRKNRDMEEKNDKTSS